MLLSGSDHWSDKAPTAQSRGETRFARTDSDRVGALVIGGALGSLDLARSLGRRGVPVRFLTSDNTIARYSRYTVASAICPKPSEPGALEWLLDYARAHALEGWALFPGGDPEVRLVAEHHDALAALFRMTAPAWDVVRWAHNKRLTYERADELGIDYPHVYRLRSRADIETGEFRFPLVLKPTSRDIANSFTMAKAWRVENRAELLALFDQAAGMVGEGDIVCQEYIPGDGTTQFSYAALCDHGVPVASLVARRTRQYPVEFGKTSTFVESCLNEEVAAASRRFVESLAYTGLVELEFKYDPRDRRYKLLDVNPRLWNWISLGAAAGVDFSFLAWRLAMGDQVSPVEGRPGAAWIHASRDALTALQLLAGRKISLSDYVRSLQMAPSLAVFAKDDILPSLVDLPVVASRLVVRQVSALLGGSSPGRVERRPENTQRLGIAPAGTEP